jgi:hypothetical protein
MLNWLFGKRQKNSQASAGSTIQQYKTNLINARDADRSAKTLGDIAIRDNDHQALLALWESISQTRHLAAIVDPCAYTVGRVVWGTQDATLEDIGFDLFSKSVASRSDLIVDKFAYIVGEVVLRTNKAHTRQRARRFIDDHATSSNAMVRMRYTYTKNRVAQRLADDGEL